MILDPKNVGIKTMFYDVCIIGLVIATIMFFGNGGTNLHKSHTWDILAIF